MKAAGKLDGRRPDGGIHLRDVLPLLPSPCFITEEFFSATSEMETGEIPEYCAPHLIFMVQAGNTLHPTQGYIDGRRFSDPWPPGLLTFYPQGTRIRAEWKGQCRKAWLELHPALMSTLCEDAPLLRLPKLHPNHLSDRLIQQTVLSLSGCVKTADTSDPLYRESLVTRLLAHLQKPASNPDWALTLDKATALAPRAVRRAKNYAHDHLYEPVSLQAWAKEMGINSFHFLRSFKASTGLSPYQYVIDQRIQQAKRFLESGLTVTEVAAQLCFSTTSHFGMSFKQRVGVSPSEWIERHIRQQSPIFRTVKDFEDRNIYNAASAN